MSSDRSHFGSIDFSVAGLTRAADWAGLICLVRARSSLKEPREAIEDAQADEKTRTATPAVFQWAKCVQSPNPFVARLLGSTANAMAWQISLSRGGIFELRSDQVSWPECGCSACPFSYGQNAAAVPVHSLVAKKRVSAHTIRHTTATHLLRAGVDINTIRAWLGHVSITTTKVYAEVDLEMKAKALANCEVKTDQPQKPWRDDKGLMEFLRTL